MGSESSKPAEEDRPRRESKVAFCTVDERYGDGGSPHDSSPPPATLVIEADATGRDGTDCQTTAESERTGPQPLTSPSPSPVPRYFRADNGPASALYRDSRGSGVTTSPHVGVPPRSRRVTPIGPVPRLHSPQRHSVLARKAAARDATATVVAARHPPISPKRALSSTPTWLVSTPATLLNSSRRSASPLVSPASCGAGSMVAVPAWPLPRDGTSGGWLPQPPHVYTGSLADMASPVDGRTGAHLTVSTRMPGTHNHSQLHLESAQRRERMHAQRERSLRCEVAEAAEAEALRSAAEHARVARLRAVREAERERMSHRARERESAKASKLLLALARDVRLQQRQRRAATLVQAYARRRLARRAMHAMRQWRMQRTLCATQAAWRARACLSCD